MGGIVNIRRFLNWQVLVGLTGIVLCSAAFSDNPDIGELVCQEELERCRDNVPGGVNSILVVRARDEWSEQPIDSLAVHECDANNRSIRLITNHGASWIASGNESGGVFIRGRDTHTLKIVSPLYKVMFVKSVVVPPNTVTVVSVDLLRGTGTEEVVAGTSERVQVQSRHIAEMCPLSRLVFKILDDSSDVPVGHATIHCEELDASVSTDSTGQCALQIDSLNRVTLSIWHPRYDSIRFEVDKQKTWTERGVTVHFQGPRDTPGHPPTRFSDSTVILIACRSYWPGWTGSPKEAEYEIYTSLVRQGEVFGPPRGIIPVLDDCLPFRLVRVVRDRRAWVQFASGFGFDDGDAFYRGTNYLVVSDTLRRLRSASADGGIYLSLQLQPDYAPTGTVRQLDLSPNARLAAWKVESIAEVDSCDLIRAEVERVHLQTLFELLTGNIDGIPEAATTGDTTQLDPSSPTMRQWRKEMTDGRLQVAASRRLAELFDLRGAEVYVHGSCGDEVNGKYWDRMNRTRNELRVGDVWVRFPAASFSGWHREWSAVYRKENGRWKIVTGGE